jgi:NhaP-type Na+/H+ or K+/H+ antiporter
MKIKSNLSINFFTIYGEAKGIARSKKRIIRTRSKIYLNYYLELFLKLFIFMIIGYYFLYSKDQIISLFAFVFLVVVVSITIIKLINVVSVYEYKYKHNFISTITIDERGIIDESFYGIKMLFKWNKILGVVVDKHCAVILTDTPVYFYFNRKDSNKIIKAIERYHKSTIVIK